MTTIYSLGPQGHVRIVMIALVLASLVTAVGTFARPGHGFASVATEIVRAPAPTKAHAGFNRTAVY